MNNPQNERRVTLKDIANALRLSRTAVAMALKNDPQIAELTRHRVQTQAREMGYYPNSMATCLAHFRQASRMPPIQAALAWLNLWPDPKQLKCYRYFNECWTAACVCAEQFGYRLEEFIWDRQLPLTRLENILHARGIHGILLPPQPGKISWEGFDWNKFSVVRLGRSPGLPLAFTVTSDHVANAMMAFDIIAKHGYRRVGFVGPQEIPDRNWLFEAGFLMAQMGLRKSDQVQLLEDSSLDVDKLRRWLEKEKPDAILTPCRDVPGILKQAGYRIPEDIAVASMNVLDGNVDTGIDQRPEEIVRIAIEMLLSLIHQNRKGIPEKSCEILVKGNWVAGNSLPLRLGESREALV